MSEKFNFDSGLFKALNQHKQKAQELAKSLEDLPVKYEQFAASEINKLLEIRNNLEKYKSNNSQSPEQLNEVIKYLDGLDVWKSKFATGSKDGTDQNDSIYYLTKDNISLRLKSSNLPQGLSHVIQPFMENATFLESDKEGTFYPSEKPIFGSIPQEYCSEEFYKLQKHNMVIDNFISKVPKFYKDGKLYFVGKPKNLFHDHPGSQVGRIFFDKP